ncbi:MAG TPA: PKD domain-containing protein [Acidobacteriaceae bacterium]|nr:PKD domain-containing protein [Acidobacteriaceae bacterium]
MKALKIQIDPTDGTYKAGASGADAFVLHAGVAAQVNGQWLQSREYPKRSTQEFTVSDDMGTAHEWAVTFSGLAGQPDLLYRLRAYPDRPFADIQVFVRNATGQPVSVGSIRPIAALGNSILDLNGDPADNRILSDSFSEDRPNITIHDLGDDDMYRGVGSQLVYNRQSHESFFAGALTSDRFLTILRIHLDNNDGKKRISAYEVDSTGTTEMETDQWGSLHDARPQDAIRLQTSLAPGAELASEKLLIGVDSNYRHQLDTYGTLIRQLHRPRVSAPTPMGWWSWTAYYFGLNSGTALTNAQWESQHLKSLGYDFFHIDEGYQYARGEYSTPNATLFPNGLTGMEQKVTNLGLVPGIWTAPFEVSVRSWVYQNHPDWLVHNAKGEPIHIGWVTDHKDALYVLDSTNPGAQDYLRKTYQTLARDWGIRYIKMDFMDDTAIEGNYYHPNTSAMEAQRIGLGIIREAVGNGVLLDKDGSVMLNPVGFVDFGRISQDTGHTFEASSEAASGIAARYFMNRNYFVADPDAFSVSRQTIDDQSWHNSTKPLSQDEAEVSIALSAVSGGMYEIGDDLPTLGSEPDRLALVQNQDLIDMARLGRSSTPVDLMSYLPADRQPSIFFLKESSRQSILTIFNWTDRARTHTVTPAILGMNAAGTYTVTDVFDRQQSSMSAKRPLLVSQPLHSVRVLKIIDTAIPARPPVVHANHLSDAKAGEAISFSATAESSSDPVLSYQWDFGDGVSLKGPRVSHAYTHEGSYAVKLTAHGLDGLAAVDSSHLQVAGAIPTRFIPGKNQRYQTSPTKATKQVLK